MAKKIDKDNSGSAEKRSGSSKVGSRGYSSGVIDDCFLTPFPTIFEPLTAVDAERWGKAVVAKCAVM